MANNSITNSIKEEIKRRYKTLVSRGLSYFSVSPIELALSIALDTHEMMDR